MRKILIVDDNALFQKTLRSSLHSQFPSIEVSEAKDGTEAFETIPTFLPDLILMDIHLSNENGLELTRLINEIADLALFLASDKAGYLTGAIIPMDGGSNPVL
jgi:CheY-like chemotaxis protein